MADALKPGQGSAAFFRICIGEGTAPERPATRRNPVRGGLSRLATTQTLPRAPDRPQVRAVGPCGGPDVVAPWSGPDSYATRRADLLREKIEELQNRSGSRYSG